ncbi:cytochrome c-type biogenesis protein [Deinococcus sp.]|uniref:cytochrome c-type biogenesis protein n=1 Tax=Deinococcus sp. TaxID=47478 RepID=UPI003B59954C
MLLALFLMGSALAAPLTPAQQAQVTRIGEGIRCPICRDVLPITESGNEISKQMLSEISAQTQAGQSDAQIYQYFRERYGQRVLLRPPNDTAGTLLWAIPALALLAGGGVLAGYLRGQRKVVPVADLPSSADESEDPYLAEIRAQVQAKREQEA